MNIRNLCAAAAAVLTMSACAKHAGEAAADVIVDVLLPVDATPTGLAVDATADVTLADAVTP